MLLFRCYKGQKHKCINTISDLAAGRGFGGTSAGRLTSGPACPLGLRLTGKKTSQPRWKHQVISVNGCVPLKRACASLILNRTAGHFRPVLAFGDKQKDRSDVI